MAKRKTLSFLFVCAKSRTKIRPFCLYHPARTRHSQLAKEPGIGQPRSGHKIVHSKPFWLRLTALRSFCILHSAFCLHPSAFCLPLDVAGAPAQG
jgi:hypothetical protein